MLFLTWAIAILVSAAAGYWVYRADVRRAVPYPWLTALLRGVVVLLALLLLLAPVLTITRNETQKPIVLFLQDDSRSVAVALGKDSATYRKNAEELSKRLSDKYKVVSWGFGSSVRTDSIFNYNQQSTDISAALERAQEFYGMQNLGAIVIGSDGRFNCGINPLYQELSLHSPVYAVALGDSAVQKDIRISQVYVNNIVSLNSQFEIRADIIASLCKGYSNNVQLTENGATVNTAALSVSADRYDRSVSFTIKAEKTGLHHYVLNVPVAEGEKNIANNRKDVFVEVTDEKRNILLACAAPNPDINAIKEALAGLEHYKVTTVIGDNLPALDNYNVIILHGLPSQGGNAAAQLKASKKPVWFIFSNRTDEAAFNQLSLSGKLNISPAPPHDVLPWYNSAFNLFTLPANMQAVTDKLPPLSVPLGYIQAPPNAGVLFAQKGNDNHLPMWMLQQGTVPYAVLSGEGIWRWRVYEYKHFGSHSVIDECIQQTVSFLSANANEKPFRATQPKHIWSDQEPVMLNAYLLNASNEQVNTPEAQVQITDSAGRKQNFSFERSGNTYKINIGVWAGGTYNYLARTTYNGKEYTSGGSFVVESVPLELMETGADYPLLYSMAKKYGGSLVPAAQIGALYDSISRNEKIKPVIETDTETVPLVDWKWYFFLLLAVAVTEWLLRKYWLAQ